MSPAKGDEISGGHGGCGAGRGLSQSQPFARTGVYLLGLVGGCQMAKRGTKANDVVGPTDSVIHTQGFEYPLLHGAVPTHARDHFNQTSCHGKGNIGIRKALAHRVN